MQGQLTIWDFLKKPLKEPAEEVAEKMNACLGTKFEKVMDDGYYLLFVYETEEHRFVINGSNKRLGFGIDNLFLAHNGYEDIKARYLRCMNN